MRAVKPPQAGILCISRPCTGLQTAVEFGDDLGPYTDCVVVNQVATW